MGAQVPDLEGFLSGPAAAAVDGMGRIITAAALSLVLLAAARPARAQCQAEDPGFVGDVAKILFEADVRWWADRPLRDGRNAHRTNTKEQFAAAMKGDYNWFEGDVRAEINHPDRLEMRHDTIHEAGDNLTLKEWLTKGKASGRGLKLDIKETKLMEQLLDTVDEVGVPDGRLMFNLGDAGMNKWGAEIRRRHPDAILAINPAANLGDHHNDGGPIQDWQVQRMLDLANRFGGKVTFVLNESQVTPEAVAALQKTGPVSVWGDVEDPAARETALRGEGVDGMIDLAKEHGLTPGDAASYAVRSVHTWWDRHF